ncbi:MAG: galactoside O-acetyltransferase [Oscillospiraceae bacterium]|nr:galactoside O-acetyltransferase [Oscillospiraceae bacterium]
MTMRDRMKNGLLFTDMCEGLPQRRSEAKNLMNAFNRADHTDVQAKIKLIKLMVDAEKDVWIESPFYFIYGKNIHLGQGSFINMNCNFIDDGQIVVGKNVLFGPAVTVVTVGHPVNPLMREYMYTDPVVIKDNVWIGANVTVCPGVTIGENSVIGAGSVVVKDIPADCVAVGNPCRVIRQIGDRDKEYYYKDRKIDPEDLKKEYRLRKTDK